MVDTPRSWHSGFCGGCWLQLLGLLPFPHHVRSVLPCCGLLALCTVAVSWLGPHSLHFHTALHTELPALRTCWPGGDPSRATGDRVRPACPGDRNLSEDTDLGQRDTGLNYPGCIHRSHLSLSLLSVLRVGFGCPQGPAWGPWALVQWAAGSP